MVLHATIDSTLIAFCSHRPFGVNHGYTRLFLFNCVLFISKVTQSRMGQSALFWGQT